MSCITCFCLWLEAFLMSTILTVCKQGTNTGTVSAELTKICIYFVRVNVHVFVLYNILVYVQDICLKMYIRINASGSEWLSFFWISPCWIMEFSVHIVRCTQNYWHMQYTYGTVLNVLHMYCTLYCSFTIAVKCDYKLTKGFPYPIYLYTRAMVEEFDRHY